MTPALTPALAPAFCKQKLQRCAAVVVFVTGMIFYSLKSDRLFKQIFFNKDIVLNFFNYLKPNEINHLAAVNKDLHLFIGKIGYEMMESLAFDSKYYQEKLKWEIEDVKLPKNIYQVYNGIYQLSIDNKIEKPPILYLIDPELDLRNMGKIMQPFFEKKSSPHISKMQEGFNHFDSILLNKCQKGYVNYPQYEEPKVRTHQKPYWGILVNGILFETKPYDIQKKLVAKLNLKLASAEEATLGVFLHWHKTGSCEFTAQKSMRTDDLAFKSGGNKCIVTIKGVDFKNGVDIELLNSHQDGYGFGVSPFFSF